MMPKYYLVIILVFSPWTVCAQADWAVYGEIRPSELRQTSSWASPSAVEMLFDLGKIEFDKKGFDIKFKRHQRIKVYKADSVQFQQIKIIFRKGDRLRKPRATRYRLEGQRIKRSELRPEEISQTLSAANTRELTLSLPGLSDGEIIEFSYEVIYEEWRDIDRWWFQNDIPTARSDLILEIPEYFEFIERSSTVLPFDTYRTSQKKIADYDVTIYHFGMAYTSAYVEEPYSNGKIDYKRNLYFELSSVHIPDVADREYFAADHEKLAEELAIGQRLGKELRGNSFLSSIVDSLCGDEKDEREISREIYEYVQGVCQVNDASDNQSIRSIHRSKEGNSWDVNRYLISLLDQAGIQSYPLLSSSGSALNYSIDSRIASSFNKLLCFAEIQEKYDVLDATDKHLPYGYLSPQDRIGKGLLVHRHEPRWLDLELGPEDDVLYTGSISIDSNWNAQADITVIHSDYAAYLFKVDNSDQPNRPIIDSYDVSEKNTSESLEITEHIQGEWQINSQIQDSEIVIDALVFGGQKSNPFVNEFRQQPIVFPSPFERRISYSITIPAGYRLKSIPEPIDIGLPEDKGYFRYLISQVGDLIVISSQFKINEKSFFQEDYPYVKELFDIMVEKHNEKLILVR